MKGFASDNNSGVHPTIMESIIKTNFEHALAYGDDQLTKDIELEFKNIFGQNAETFFVFNGTAANVLGITAVCKPYEAVICVSTAHINTDECGAPERFSGCKLLTVPSVDGKLKVNDIEHFLHAFGFQHHSQPRVISISQPTEMGTVYTLNEIKTIAEFAHNNNMLLHIDGARLSNAAATLNCSLAATTIDVGADFISFGGTKNGLMFGEAIVFFNRNLATNFLYLRKQGMQLGSKMRFISAQFKAYLENEQWRKTASHANKMALLLADKVRKIEAVKITQEVHANALFAIIPKTVIENLQQKYFFYVWDETTSEVRWMTSWDTTEEEIINFGNLLEYEMKRL